MVIRQSLSQPQALRFGNQPIDPNGAFRVDPNRLSGLPKHIETYIRQRFIQPPTKGAFKVDKVRSSGMPEHVELYVRKQYVIKLVENPALQEVQAGKNPLEKLQRQAAFRHIPGQIDPNTVHGLNEDGDVYTIARYYVSSEQQSHISNRFPLKAYHQTQVPIKPIEFQRPIVPETSTSDEPIG
jgi:hypothetical protein